VMSIGAVGERHRGRLLDNTRGEERIEMKAGGEPAALIYHCSALHRPSDVPCEIALRQSFVLPKSQLNVL
jgi:hypothetical protein